MIWWQKNRFLAPGECWVKDINLRHDCFKHNSWFNSFDLFSSGTEMQKHIEPKSIILSDSFQNGSLSSSTLATSYDLSNRSINNLEPTSSTTIENMSELNVRCRMKVNEHSLTSTLRLQTIWSSSDFFSSWLWFDRESFDGFLECCVGIRSKFEWNDRSVLYWSFSTRKKRVNTMFLWPN